MTKKHIEEMIKGVDDTVSSLAKTIEDFENLNIALSKQNTQYAAKLIDDNCITIIKIQEEVKRAYRFENELRAELSKLK